MKKQGNRLADSTKPAPILIADHPALDYLNTVGAPYGSEIEWLENGQGLVSWMTAAGILSVSRSTEISGGIPARELDAAADGARQLREWFRNLLTRHDNQLEWRFEADQVESINRILMAGTHRFRLQFDSSGERRLEFAGQYEIDTAEDLLLPIAHAIADLMTEMDRLLVRQCAGPNCTFWFNDLTKNRKRRWCDMKVCGNRAKSAAFRERRKDA